MAKVFRMSDGTWKVDEQYRLGKKRVHLEKRGFKTEKEAKKAIAELEEEATKKYQGRFGTKGFDDLMESFLEKEATRKRASSYSNELRIFKVHIKPRWTGKSINQAFSEPSLKGFKAYLGRLSVTVDRKNRVIHQFLSLASFGVLGGVVSTSQESLAITILEPFKNDGMEIRKEKIALTKEQYKAFISTFALTDKYRAMFELWFYLGLRSGEMMGLRWSDVNLDDGDVFINSQRQYIEASKSWETVALKTSKSRRHLHLNEFLISEMRLLKEAYPGEWVFFGGSPISKHPIVESLKSHCLKAAIPVISPHEIRHTVASWLVAASDDYGDLIEVSRWLGHSSTKETLDTYSHYLKKTSSIADALNVN